MIIASPAALKRKGVPMSAIGARAQGKAYFFAVDPCPDCDHSWCWSHNGQCMACHPHDGDRLGIDAPHFLNVPDQKSIIDTGNGHD